MIYGIRRDSETLLQVHHMWEPRLTSPTTHQVVNESCPLRAEAELYTDVLVLSVYAHPARRR